MYLVKDATRIENLKKAGVASAEVKITNLDGILFFTNCISLKITSNSVEGALDLTTLSKLETLEMNNNQVTELYLPSSLTRFRFNSSTNTLEELRLKAIDLSKLSSLNHISLTNQRLSKDNLRLPDNYSNLKEIDLTGNPEAPFEIPSDLFAQLITAKGVIEADDNNGGEPEIPSVDGYEVKDKAFAEYLLYLTESVDDETLRLPAGSVYKSDDKIYINTEVASTYTGHLNINKASSFITKLTNAGVVTASVKIQDADGLQYFSSITELTATSNEFVAELPFHSLPNLKKIVVRTAGISSMNLSENVALIYLDIQGSTKLSKLTSVNLYNNINLEYVNLSSNEIDPEKFILPASYAYLTTLNMGKNTVSGKTVTYGVPSELFNALGYGDARAGLEEIVE